MKRMNEEKLKQMADFVRRYIAANNGRSPRFGEICKHMGMTNSVCYRYLLTLRDRGVIEYSGRDSLAVKGQDRMHTDFRSVAVLGAIPCGEPEEHTQLVDGYLALPEEWVGGECYLLRADGDSMIGAGIDDGDLVLIRRTDSARAGQIVVALVDGTDTTLKRYFIEDGVPVLHPENPRYVDIHPTALDIQGVAVRVIKELE